MRMPSHKLLLLNKESREADLSKSRPGWHMLSGQTRVSSLIQLLSCFLCLQMSSVTMLPASVVMLSPTDHGPGPWAEYSGCLAKRVSEDLSL